MILERFVTGIAARGQVCQAATCPVPAQAAQPKSRPVKVWRNTARRRCALARARCTPDASVVSPVQPAYRRCKSRKVWGATKAPQPTKKGARIAADPCGVYTAAAELLLLLPFFSIFFWVPPMVDGGTDGADQNARR